MTEPAADAAGLVDSPAAVHNVVVLWTGVSRLEQEKREAAGNNSRKGSADVALDVGS
ncbi:hypothetical protein NC652_018272 [Populus alba x Populus x berolinensis]|nr:hypothetical protein NC652_018272 [Populus alba x Populus x berolinensis]